MYKLLLSLIIGILTFATVCIGISHPQMHKTLFVYNSDYKIVETAKVETVKNLPAQINPPPVQKAVKKVEKKVPQAVTKTEKKPIQTEEVKVVQTPAPNPLLTMLKETTTTEPVQTVTPAKTVETKTVSEEEKAREELILWNQWRSNLQNKIMSDVKLPIMPEGTIFKFSFDVDKYGKISNVQTWSLTPSCTPYAIQYIAPVIRGYQGREILRFPAGSNRVSTTVEGGWKISQTAKFSTPDDYKDFEKIINKD